MKSIKEIQIMLVDELKNSLASIKSLNSEKDYHNDILGDTSFLLSGLLDSLLRLRNDWDSKKWLDDSLIENVNLRENKLSITGVMILGNKNTTKQWVDPFCFEIELSNNEYGFKEYTFLFGDLKKHEISYEKFRMNRNYWKQIERDWKYIINKKLK